jgi:phage terminase large subunit-like protein
MMLFASVQQRLKISPLTKEHIRQAAESDLLAFARLVNPHRVYGAVHEELFRWWTRESGKDNQLVLLPRDHQKSHCVAVRVAWEITRNPDTTVLYVSAVADLAEKQLLAIKNILESKKYRDYWPDMINPDPGLRTLWNVAEISVDHPKRKLEGVRDPTVKACGLTTNFTGFHANVVVLDDVVVPANAYTEDGREKVSAMYSQLSSVETTDAREWVVGTRYHPKDLYGTLIEMVEETYDTDGNVSDQRPVYEIFQKVVEEDGQFLWPRQMRRDGKFFGFDENILARKKAKYIDTTQFFAQYYNNPNDSSEARIDVSKFQYYDRQFLSRTAGTWFYKDKPLNLVAAIDFAFSLSKKADYSCIAVIGIDPEGYIYVLDIDRFKEGKISGYFKHILDSHVKWDFRKLRAEVTVAQAAIVNELKDHIRQHGLSLSIEEHRPTRHQGHKEERIAAILEPRYDNLTILHYKGGNCQVLEEELTLAHPAHDDVKDSLAAAVEIAIPPRGRGHKISTQNSNVIYHERFGGVRH